ncbi:hypothetical protein LEP1GSC188_3548 [Leptospira weilii serovar Topaz str. LT2116]|uniref:Uncharacterized protein n=1 Tax=Leptospira weilii serovar Topaz str. LT2116 TaxID=1088540 RepID=M3GX71_9LEPT|nr:hypothetical protein LEP1GSC188_3548 [Leptospira weilii serovar Topaz str. LT2116]
MEPKHPRPSGFFNRQTHVSLNRILSSLNSFSRTPYFFLWYYKRRGNDEINSYDFRTTKARKT